MSTALQNLLAKAKQTKAGESATPAAQPETAPAAQQVTAPAAQQVTAPAAQPETAPAAQPDPAQTAPAAADASEEREVAIRTLTPLISSDEEAMQALAALTSDFDEETSLSAISASVDTGTGMSHTFPFASIRNENWDVNNKYMPEEIYRYMPAGNRPFYGVYICHRIGGTGWIGAGSAGKGGNPPAWRFALPDPRVVPSVAETARAVLKIGRKIQFTKGDERVKFDVIGRLTPEVHILVWTPECGFVILVGPGHKTVEDTLKDLEKVEKRPMTPVRFGLEIDEVVNKKVQKVDPNAKNASWTDTRISVNIVAEKEIQRIGTAWQEFLSRDRVAVANAATNFRMASDFDGLSAEEVQTLADAYTENGLL